MKNLFETIKLGEEDAKLIAEAKVKLYMSIIQARFPFFNVSISEQSFAKNLSDCFITITVKASEFKPMGDPKAGSGNEKEMVETPHVMSNIDVYLYPICHRTQFTRNETDTCKFEFTEQEIIDLIVNSISSLVQKKRVTSQNLNGFDDRLQDLALNLNN